MKTLTRSKPALAILTLSLGFGSVLASPIALAEEQEKPYAIANEYIDLDQDGVKDDLDHCLGTPSIFTVDKDGCPIITLDNALFDFDSPTLNSTDLEKLKSSLTTLPALKSTEVILITGHTDSLGSNAYNMALSWKRANTVKNFMVSTLNFSDNTVWIDGQGESKPVADNDTPESRHKNRRVEVKVIPKDTLPNTAQTSYNP